MDCNKRWSDAIGHAWDGVWYCLRRQRHMQLGVLVSLVVMLAAWYCRFSRLEWALLLLTMLAVLALEMVNTALEAVVDMVTMEYHQLAKLAKDVAAGAVLLACLAAVGVGICLFIFR